jgi:hypothetical protein
MSDVVASSPSNRTRDLARRIEQHMGRKQELLQQKQQQQQREYIPEYDPRNNGSPSHPSTTVNTRVIFEEPTTKQTSIPATSRNPNLSTKQISQPHFYYPQNQLGATYLPIPKPQQYIDTSTNQNHRHRHHHHTPPSEMEPTSSNPRCEKRVASTKKVSSQQHQDNIVSRPMDFSNTAVSYPPKKYQEDIPEVSPTNSNTSSRSKPSVRRMKQQHDSATSKTLLLRPDCESSAIMNEHVARRSIPKPHQPDIDRQSQQPVTQHRTSRRPEQLQLPQQQQPRSRSLGPPQRRRQQSVRESDPTDLNLSSNGSNLNDDVELPQNETGSIPNDPLIRRLGNRAEIETPLPANVRQLRRMLWTEDELLQVKTRSSYRDIEHNGGCKYDGQKTHIGGPEMAGAAGQRNARSLSPKTHRIRNHNENRNTSSSRLEYGGSAREQKGMLFKSRYYEAALRGEMSTSPKRGGIAIPAATDQDGSIIHGSVPMTKSFDSVTMAKQQKSSSASDIRSGSYETTLAIQPDMTNSSSTRPTTNSTQNIKHRQQLEVTGASMKEDYAMYLLRKINQVNKDDPQAALAEINALLSQQPTVSAMPAESTPKKDMKRVDDPVSRETFSVPGVEQARPMEGDNESDDESDGTSVSSMTNPTFVDQSHKDRIPTSPSSGRPRPSVLGSYNKPSSNISSTNKITTETQPKNPAKEEQNVATELDQRTSNDAVGNSDTGLQQFSNNEAAKCTGKPSVRPADNPKPDILDEKSTSSLLAQLGSLISPRRAEDVQSKEISVKMKQWDDLSTGAIPVDTDRTSKTKVSILDSNTTATKTGFTKSEVRSEDKVFARRDLSPGSALKRDHPWDAAIPVRMGQVNMKDTSMDSGDGIEAEFSPRYPKPLISSQFTDAPSSVGKQNDSPAQPTTSRNKTNDQKKEAPQYTSNKHQKAKDMSDDFDSAWVSLPSTFFRSNQSIEESDHINVVATDQRSNVPTTHQSEEQAQEKMSTDSAVDDVEVEYVHNTTRIRSGEVQTIAPEESNHSYLQLKSPKREVYPRHRKSSMLDDGCEEKVKQSVLNVNSFETAPVTSDETKPRGRGLIGFLKRKQAEKAQAGSVMDRTSASVVSRRSAATTTTTTATRPLGELADIEACPSNGNDSELVNRYSRRSAKSRSPSRTRSRSVDERRTMRTPSLARKFNRLLRVYDHDNTELTEV